MPRIQLVDQQRQRQVIMALAKVLHMNIGDGDSSYANNSMLQGIATQKALPLLKHSIKSIANHGLLNDCFTVADFGCSSGANTLLVVSNIHGILHDVCQEDNIKVPQFQVCLNDLYGNDFNSIFKSLPDFYEKLKKNKGESSSRPFFVSAVPGSFYDRLFPDQSLHLVHCSTSNHWLSQVPQGLENNGLNIFITSASPPNVYQAYQKQYHNDFVKFLRVRSEELVHGGSMVLTLLARSAVDPTIDDCFSQLELVGESLADLLQEGLIEESDINSFNMPVYFPCEDEVRSAIEYEGSFSLENMDVFRVNWDPDDTDYTNMNDSDELSKIHGRNNSKLIRAVLEPLLTSHFGNSIIDLLFNKLEKRVAEHLTKKKTRNFFITCSLARK